MSSWDDYAEAELERVMCGETIRHPVHMHKDYGGGEWDALRALPRDIKRTLTGARMLTPRGLHPDEAFVFVQRGLGTWKIHDVDDAVDWYVATCLTVIRQRRRIAHWKRHHKLAVRNGYRSYWYYRKAYLQEREEQAA